MKAKHTHLNTLKKLESIDDYRKILAKDYSSAWKTATVDDIVDCFGMPKQYPCFVKTETITDPEPDWGNGIEKYYHFYYL
jgi:hypothetical protein